MGKHIPLCSPSQLFPSGFAPGNNLVLFPLVILCMLKCLLDVLMGGIVDLVAYTQLQDGFRPPDP